MFVHVIFFYPSVDLICFFQWNWFVYQKTQKKISDKCSTGHETGQGKSNFYTALVLLGKQHIVCI